MIIWSDIWNHVSNQLQTKSFADALAHPSYSCHAMIMHHIAALDVYLFLLFVTVGSAPQDTQEYPSEGAYPSADLQGKHHFLSSRYNPKFPFLLSLIALEQNISNGLLR